MGGETESYEPYPLGADAGPPDVSTWNPPEDGRTTDVVEVVDPRTDLDSPSEGATYTGILAIGLLVGLVAIGVIAIGWWMLLVLVLVCVCAAVAGRWYLTTAMRGVFVGRHGMMLRQGWGNELEYLWDDMTEINLVARNGGTALVWRPARRKAAGGAPAR